MQQFGALPEHLKALFKLQMDSSHYYRQHWYWWGEAHYRTKGGKLASHLHPGGGVEAGGRCRPVILGDGDCQKEPQKRQGGQNTQRLRPNHERCRPSLPVLISLSACVWHNHNIAFPGMIVIPTGEGNFDCG